VEFIIADALCTTSLQMESSQEISILYIYLFYNEIHGTVAWIYHAGGINLKELDDRGTSAIATASFSTETHSGNVLTMILPPQTPYCKTHLDTAKSIAIESGNTGCNMFCQTEHAPPNVLLTTNHICCECSCCPSKSL
jgi:hypothetical protein